MRKTILSVLILFIMTQMLTAQEVARNALPVEKDHRFAVQGQASTNGFGAGLVYSLSNNFDVRAGYERLNFNTDFNFDENDITYGSSLDYKTGSISVLADYYPVRYFFLSGGIGFNMFNPVVNGKAISDWQYGDISLPPDDIGDFRFSFKPSLKLSPYAGIGFGRVIGLKKSVAFNFEVGTFYFGSPKVDITATGLLSPTADPAHGQEKLFENQLKQYHFYPVVKFGISVKLF